MRFPHQDLRTGRVLSLEREGALFRKLNHKDGHRSGRHPGLPMYEAVKSTGDHCVVNETEN